MRAILQSMESALCEPPRDGLWGLSGPFRTFRLSSLSIITLDGEADSTVTVRHTAEGVGSLWTDALTFYGNIGFPFSLVCVWG